MAYISLARKYRPKRFSEVIGQELVLSALKGGILKNTLPRSMIFSGPRGTGKTTLCRILAKAINCLNPIDGFEPCLKCQTCTSQVDAASLSYFEVDGASYNGVEMVRELMSTFQSLPPNPFRYKFYVIDEAHMLSNSAFNAMLKSIEEPPGHVFLTLVTTEPNKIPVTVQSRCVHFEFESIPSSLILENLKKILELEKIQVEEHLLYEISKMAKNSIRDSLTLLDRFLLLHQSGQDNIFLKWINKSQDNRFLELLDSCLSYDAKKATEIFKSLLQDYLDLDFVIRSFAEISCDFLDYFISPNSVEDKFHTLKEKHKYASVNDLSSMIINILDLGDSSLRSSFGELIFQAGLIKLTSKSATHAEREEINQVKNEKQQGRDQRTQQNSVFNCNQLKDLLQREMPTIKSTIRRAVFNIQASDETLYLEIKTGVVSITVLEKHRNKIHQALKSLWPNFKQYHISFNPTDESNSETTPPPEVSVIEDFERKLLQGAEKIIE